LLVLGMVGEFVYSILNGDVYIFCWSFDGECTYCSHLFQNVSRVEDFTLIVVEYTMTLMQTPARKLKEQKVWETTFLQCSTSCISSTGDISKQQAVYILLECL
jgi:hypothetical protein